MTSSPQPKKSNCAFRNLYCAKIKINLRRIQSKYCQVDASCYLVWLKKRLCIVLLDKDNFFWIISSYSTLKNITCRFPNASMNTVKLANMHSIHIIQTKMTFIKYPLKDKHTFKAIKCNSALIPCSLEERIHLMSVWHICVFICKSCIFLLKFQR